MDTFRIDHRVQFDKLARAPIAEAVLDLRVRPIATWDQDEIRIRLKAALPDYPDVKSQRRWQTQMQVQDDRLPTTITQDHGLLGVIMRSADGKQVTQFQRDGFSFSRLRPYEGWRDFHAEAMRLWRIYVEQTNALGVNRLGLRFINQIDLQTVGAGRVDDVLTLPPAPPPGVNLPLAGFFAQEAFTVPDSPFSINLIRAIDAASVIIDIDVFTTNVDEDEHAMNGQIDDMRWLKNKIFFASITQQAKESMR